MLTENLALGCLTCHNVNRQSNHGTPLAQFRLGCTDCHGGNSEARGGPDKFARIPPAYAQGEESRPIHILSKADTALLLRPIRERAYTGWFGGRKVGTTIRFVKSRRTCAVAGKKPAALPVVTAAEVRKSSDQHD